MKKLFTALIGIVSLLSCTNQREAPHRTKDKTIELQTDTVNVVKLTDKLVIYESTCGGCEYEKTTRFEINDSLNLVKLKAVITTDTNPPDMDGGSICKDLIITPIKNGVTTIRVYKIWGPETASKDSANYKLYTIDLRN